MSGWLGRRFGRGRHRGRPDPVLQQLSRLPRLGDNPIDTIPCKICAHPAAAFDLVDFNKACSWELYPFGMAGVPVTYFRCFACGFIFTTFFDSWGPQEFSRFIYNDDYILVDPEYSGARARRTAADIGERLKGCEGARILDYGSGAGIFASEMQARGFDTVAYDPFSAPQRPQGRFDIVTCFEAIEHTPFPLAAFADIAGFLADDGAIIVGQSLQPPNIAELRGNWWYIAPRNGHVSIFAEATFELIAARFGLALYCGGGVYGFSRQPRAALNAALRRIGPLAVALQAPPEAAEGWNEAERYHQMIGFRWTCASEIAWPPRVFAAGSYRLRIPYLMEAAPGFAANSRIQVGETPLPTAVTAGSITALAEFEDAATAAIRLVTPPPPLPEERGSPADRRRLGLAIPIEPPP